jgi:TolB-like protein/cytochrome c-type biogenesis protein CcmH/NrfG
LVGIAAFDSRLTGAPIRIDHQIAARNTVAVMPFVVSANEPELRDAADAAADQVEAQLSKRLGMRGIGRASTSAADGSALPMSQIASVLKASHVLTGRAGSVAGGQRIVIDVQLGAVPQGDVIWAKRFEAAAADRLTLARDIGLQVANAMRNRPEPFERALASVQSGELDAVELTLLGWCELDRRKSMEDVLRARTRFETALRTDPNSQIALNGVASSYFIQRMDPMARFSAEQAVQHEQIVDRIRKLGPEDATGLMMWGNLQLMRGRADLALPALERASQLAPSHPNNYVLIGRALLLSGRTAEVQPVTSRAVELGAGDPRRVSDAHLVAAEAALMRGEDDRAYDLAGRSIAVLPTNARAHALLAAIDALAGRPGQAETELATFLGLWPTATVARYDEVYRSTHPVFVAQRERLYEGLRMAGLTER